MHVVVQAIRHTVPEGHDCAIGHEQVAPLVPWPIYEVVQLGQLSVAYEPQRPGCHRDPYIQYILSMPQSCIRQ